MKHYTYLAAMGFTFIGSIWLEVFLKVSVLKRIRRVLLTILPVGIAFVLWDRFAITQGHWRFDNAQVLPLNRIWGLPLEEYLFFIFVPLAAILTIEAVRKVNGHWKVGDER
jgi:lycopene cyclase domain-containing protein